MKEMNIQNRELRGSGCVCCSDSGLGGTGSTGSDYNKEELSCVFQAYVFWVKDKLFTEDKSLIVHCYFLESEPKLREVLY